eukprot:7076480-Pyramimonas_sp.AAC.1
MGKVGSLRAPRRGFLPIRVSPKYSRIWVSPSSNSTASTSKAATMSSGGRKAKHWSFFTRKWNALFS